MPRNRPDHSVCIFGITGGIGNEVYRQIRGTAVKVYGYYYSNEKLARSLRKEKKLKLFKMDLAKQNNFTFVRFPNPEVLIYVVGKPLFSSEMFECGSHDIRDQINLNIYSLLTLISTLSNRPKSKLKKVIIVGTRGVSKTGTIYHLFKHLQEEMLRYLVPVFRNKGISISIIKASWVRTEMLHKYFCYEASHLPRKAAKHIEAIDPIEVAKKCVSEIHNNARYTELLIP